MPASCADPSAGLAWCFQGGNAGNDVCLSIFLADDIPSPAPASLLEKLCGSDLGPNPLTDKPGIVNYLFSARLVPPFPWPCHSLRSHGATAQWTQAARAKERRSAITFNSFSAKSHFISAEKTTSLLLPSLWMSWVLNPAPTFHAVPSVLSYPAVLDTSLSPRSGFSASSPQTFWCAVLSLWIAPWGLIITTADTINWSCTGQIFYQNHPHPFQIREYSVLLHKAGGQYEQLMLRNETGGKD